MVKIFIRKLRNTLRIDDGVSIEKHLKNLGMPDCYPEYMRVEITWDGWYSLWSISFDSAGIILDERVLFTKNCSVENQVNKILSAASRVSVDQALRYALPKLKAISESFYDYPDDFDVAWEWHVPTFAGIFDASWEDSNWQDAKLPKIVE